MRLLPAHRLRTFREWFLQLPEEHQPPGVHPRGARDSAPWIGPTETFRETNDLAYYVPPLTRALLMSLGSEPSVAAAASAPSAPGTPLRSSQARQPGFSSGDKRCRGGSSRVAAQSVALPGEASEGDSASEATPRPAPPREVRGAAAHRHSERALAAPAMPQIAASPRSASDGAPGCGESPSSESPRAFRRGERGERGEPYRAEGADAPCRRAPCRRAPFAPVAAPSQPPQPAQPTTCAPMAVVRPTFATPLALAGAPRAVPPPAHPSPLLPMPRASAPLRPVSPWATSLQRLPLPSAAAGSLQPARPRPLPLPPVAREGGSTPRTLRVS